MSASSSRSSQRSEPWETQQPFLERLYNDALQNYEGRSQLEGAEGVEQNLFDRAMSDVQSGGSDVLQGLGNFLTGSLGASSGGNPYLDTIGQAGSGWNPYIGANNSYVGANNPYIGGIQQASGGSNPYLSAIGQAGSGWNPYIGASNTGIEGVENASSAANPYIGAVAGAGAQQNPYLANVARYGAQNPWLDRTFDRASQSVSDQFNRDVIPGLNSTFGSAGRTGGGLHGQTFTDAAGQHGDTLNNLATDIYGGAYESDANRRLQRDVTAGQLGEAERARNLLGTSSAAGFSDSALDRLLRGATSAAGFRAQDLNRSSGLYGQGLDRNLQAALGQAGFASGDADRQLQGAASAAGFGAQDLSRSSGLASQDLDRSSGLFGQGLDRFLRAALGQADYASGDANRNAGLVSTYENLQRQNRNDLASFANPMGRYLRDFQSLISPALMQSSGSGSSKGFGLPSITA